ncbi:MULTISPECIES: thiamine pyrophosphate-binding protein [unclassified Nesterenkonia]|uniref:thiamine pyrophosphate-binding protein n=1 Tax=unclassified Nesterenkonia TaxID=2629769 RepID=UPI001F4C6879|nr:MULTISPECIES: thiamine pyrophosphate-binding protein [unclassified Nesterenkonia]MCH8559267.1 thiamine pyrophosphate-binding protein [Nesterenkonia sp. DZ6]MCH8563153.1 thiamine pyrophosphate-binding protein [Nesterenkonia sp. YGD6]MCH8571612.1 thiamine pyrophosphate-binding protein [Nesterenkonia sp. AY15]
MTVAEQVGAYLARLGVGHAFGVVGSGNFVVTNALRDAGVPFTASRHEGGAATMADAYSRMSGQVSVLSLHQGCGLTNAGTGISEAAKSRTPMIVLAAETAAAQVHSNFAMDQRDFARALLAEPDRVHSAESALTDTLRAYRTAVRDRRTVVLNLPLDVQASEAIGEIPHLTVEPRPETAPSEGDLEKLIEAISHSERPVFVAGRGGRGAKRDIAALARATGALLATSAVAKGLFHGDDFDLGISGGFSSPLTAELISDADLIVAFGCALNMWTMRHGKLIGRDTVVAQIDVEDSALGAQRPVDIPVLGSAAGVAQALLGAFDGRERTRYRTTEVRQRIATLSRWDQTPTEVLGTPGQSVDPRELSKEINRILPAERIVSIDSGNFMGYPSQYFDVPDEFGFCFTQAFQSIGLGLYTAIGSALAQPHRMPVLGTGDGGFLMAVQELETAVRLQLPLVVVVYNDAAYSAEVHHFGEDQDLTTVTFPDTDIAAIARGFGATGITVRSTEDLEPLREWVSSDPNCPVVIDAKIADDGGSWWLAEAFKGH